MRPQPSSPVPTLAPAVPTWGGRWFWALALWPTMLAAQWGPWIPALHEGLRWEGRLRFDQAGAAVFDWAGVQVHAQVQAQALAIYARLGGNYMDVLADGRRVAVLGPAAGVGDTAWAGLGVQPKDAGGTPVYVVTGLPAGPWRLTLAKRTAANSGPVTVLGLRLAGQGAALHAPPPEQERRLEFVGDSLTNAYGVEGPGKQCPSLAPYENSTVSWALLAARALGAEAHLLAYSGHGLVRNYGAPGRSSDDPVPFYYPRILAAEPSPWDRNAYRPQAVVIHLGTNDHSTAPSPSTEAFEEAYRLFLDQVREGRTGLKILLAHPDDNSPLARRVKAVAENQQAVGHWVEALGLPQPAAEEEWGCDWHPKAAVHERWARLAEARLRKMMGW